MVNAVRELAQRYLGKLYQLSEQGLNPIVDAHKLRAELGFSFEEFAAASDYLESKDLISWKCPAPCVQITTRGIDMMQETFEEKERRVLQLLLEQRRNHPDGFYPEELATALSLDLDEVREIVVELEAKGWAAGGDETTWIIPPGIKELQKKPEPMIPVNYMHIEHNYGNAAQGSDINQNTTQIKNEFDSSIRDLLSAVQASSELSTVQKMTLENDIRTVQQLGQLEHTPEVIETVSSKVEFINSVISSTADMVSIGMVVIPIIRAFFGL